jgi:hypothetical protein
MVSGGKIAKRIALSAMQSAGMAISSQLSCQTDGIEFDNALFGRENAEKFCHTSAVEYVLLRWR